jgi:hypothetical protein
VTLTKESLKDEVIASGLFHGLLSSRLSIGKVPTS